MNFKKIIENIKEVAGVKTDQAVANLLGCSLSALSHRAKRNTVPHDEIIKYCLEKNISLDLIYGEVVSKELEAIPLKAIDKSQYYLKKIREVNSKKEFYFPVKNLDDSTLEGFAFDNNFYVVNTSIKTFNYDGLYIIHNDDNEYIVKNLQSTLSDEVLVFSTKNDIAPVSVSKKALVGLIFGKVLYTFPLV